MPLRPNRHHRFPAPVPNAEPQDCERCGYTLGAGQEPLPLCPGMRQGRLLQQRKPLPVYGPKRKRRAREGRVYGDRFEQVSMLPCPIHPGRGIGHPAHHHRRVSQGGTDEDGLIPFCIECHSELEQIGPTRFQAKHGVDLDELVIRPT